MLQEVKKNGVRANFKRSVISCLFTILLSSLCFYAFLLQRKLCDNI